MFKNYQSILFLTVFNSLLLSVYTNNSTMIAKFVLLGAIVLVNCVYSEAFGKAIHFSKFVCDNRYKKFNLIIKMTIFFFY